MSVLAPQRDRLTRARTAAPSAGRSFRAVVRRGLRDYVWPLAIFFSGLALLATGFLHRSAPVTAISAGTLVGMYVIDLVGKLAEPLEPFRAVTVFKYSGSGLTEGIDPVAFAGLTVCGVLLALAGALLLERRDVLA